MMNTINFCYYLSRANRNDIDKLKESMKNYSSPDNPPIEIYIEENSQFQIENCNNTLAIIHKSAAANLLNKISGKFNLILFITGDSDILEELNEDEVSIQLSEDSSWYITTSRLIENFDLILSYLKSISSLEECNFNDCFDFVYSRTLTALQILCHGYFMAHHNYCISHENEQIKSRGTVALDSIGWDTTNYRPDLLSTLEKNQSQCRSSIWWKKALGDKSKEQVEKLLELKYKKFSNQSNQDKPSLHSLLNAINNNTEIGIEQVLDAYEFLLKLNL